MANIKSQLKRNRHNQKRRLRKREARTDLATRTKSAIAAAEAGADDADELLLAAIKRIDKAAQSGVLHKNTAARRKSRLVKRCASAAS